MQLSCFFGSNRDEKHAQEDSTDLSSMLDTISAIQSSLLSLDSVSNGLGVPAGGGEKEAAQVHTTNAPNTATRRAVMRSEGGICEGVYRSCR